MLPAGLLAACLLLAPPAEGSAPLDETVLDTTQCGFDTVAPHPAEASIIENLLQAGATCSMNRHGRLLMVYAGSRATPPPPYLLSLLDGTPALRAISLHRAGDSHLARLAAVDLPRLEMLLLTDCPLGDESLKHFARFPTLQCLNLERTRITDRGLAHLSKLPDLLLLRLNGTAVTDEGLKTLAACPKLRHLELEDTAVTSAGLAHLAEISSLKTLYLRGTRITDAGLAHLQALPELYSLALDRTAITDAGLFHFSQPGGLRNVQHLYLEQTQITDAGIRHLDSLPRLLGVSLSGTRTTAASVSRLKLRPQLYWITTPR